MRWRVGDGGGYKRKKSERSQGIAPGGVAGGRGGGREEKSGGRHGVDKG